MQINTLNFAVANAIAAVVFWIIYPSLVRMMPVGNDGCDGQFGVYGDGQVGQHTLAERRFVGVLRESVRGNFARL